MGPVSAQRTVVRAIALLTLFAIAVAAGILVAIVGALLIHQVLVLTVGEEGIPDIDGTFLMTALLFGNYAIAIVAGLAVLVFGWRRFVRPRT
jgi:protein-S-isoprenylcysteine O-methyltransferase Ste14